MDGITFLKKIMIEKPTPVIICSSLAEKGAELSLNALAAGAFDIVTKPTMGIKNFLQSSGKEIISTVKAAATAKIQKTPTSDASLNLVRSESLLSVFNEKTMINTNEDTDLAAMAETTDKVIGIGSSTGGTIALEKILIKLPRTCPGIVIVQHMPEKFTGAFAERLNSLCEIEILEASSGDRVLPGRALIAPGGKHLQVKRSGGAIYNYCF